MLQRLWLRPAGAARSCTGGRGRRAAHRHRLPVLLRRARRGAEPRPRPGRGADRARPRGQRARARPTRTPPLPPYVVPAGRAVPVPYNGSVARLAFGPVSAARVRRWLARRRVRRAARARADHARACRCWPCCRPRGPVVATFHTAMTRSRALAAAQGVLQLVLEKITARIAVSELARKVQVEHLGGGAVEIPNGVAVARFAAAAAAAGLARRGRHARLPGPVHRAAQGLPGPAATAFVTLAAAAARAAAAGGRPGRPRRAVDDVPGRPARPGRVPRPGHRGGQGADAAQRRRLRRAEHRRRVVRHDPDRGDGGRRRRSSASDLDAFRRVLDGGRAGALFPVGDAAALATLLGRAAGRPGPAGRAGRQRRREVVAAYDWPAVAARVLEVYATGDRGHRRPRRRRTSADDRSFRAA